MSQNKQTPKEEEVLEEALSPIVNRLIDKNFENSGEKMASHIAPLIGGAIREQIKHQKDDIVDALYPVMGNMISKFVTKSLEELLNKINDQIQNGLSAQAIKRKIKAKIKGVSETQLLLEENSEAKIKAALLIHKESGSLLCKAEDANASLSDADMLASMMSAIRSFVNEWVNNNESYKELGEIEYGGNKIIIEASGSSYLAVIVEGASYTKTYEKIRHALEKIVLEYGESIQNFDGNFENFPKEQIEAELQNLVNQLSQDQEKKPKTSPLLWIIPALAIAYFSYICYKDYQDKLLQDAILNKIDHTPALTSYKIDVAVKDGTAILKGSVPFAYYKLLIDKQLKDLKGIKEMQNEVKIIPTLTDPMQVSAHIAYLLKGINLNPKNNITYNFDYTNLTLEGVVADKKTKEELGKALQKINGIKSIQDNTKIAKDPIPNFSAEFYFQTGSTQLDPEAEKKLLKLIKILQKNNSGAVISIKAYSDMIGKKEKNRKLALQRINAIKTFLQKHNLQNQIKTEVFDRPPEGVDPKKDPQKARCITLSLEKGA